MESNSDCAANTENEFLLNDRSRADLPIYFLRSQGLRNKLSQPNFSRLMLKISTLINVVLLVLTFISAPFSPWSCPGQSVLNTVAIESVTGLKYDHKTVYQHHTEYRSSNSTLADELWDALPTDPIVVAISDEWAAKHRLPKSARWPWDHQRGRYFIRAFHELHCLKYIRRYVLDWQQGRGEEVLIGEHALHCLDMLRQSVMCRADDTLQPTSDDTNFAIGDGQSIMCRDFDALIHWSQASERNACHRTISDYQTIRHPIERYGFCPDSSPYKRVQEKYFHDHGHVDPFN